MHSSYPFELVLHLVAAVLGVAAAVLAVRLIPLAGKLRAWVLFLGALAILVLDRMLELLAYGGMLAGMSYNFINDVLDVLMAGCFLGCAFYLRELFEERSEVQHKLQQQLDELQRFRQVSIGREQRMMALYEENQALKVRLGEGDG